MLSYPIILISEEKVNAFPERINFDYRNLPLGGDEDYNLYKTLGGTYNVNIELHFKVALNSNFYYPDVLYWNKKRNILIDIEIDEPYARSNNSPIHCIDNQKDILRNKLFLKNGWSVIRFSEYQIVKFKDECLKLFKEVLYSIENDKPFVFNKAKYPGLFVHSQWSENEALEMARNSIRNRYDFKIKEKIQEGQTKIISNYPSIDDFISDIMGTSISQNDSKNKFIYNIFDISDILINPETKCEAVFIKLNKFDLQSYHSEHCHDFSNPHLYYSFIVKKNDSQLFYDLIHIKKEGEKIKINDDYLDIYYNCYNLFFIGSNKKNDVDDPFILKNPLIKQSIIYIRELVKF